MYMCVCVYICIIYVYTKILIFMYTLLWEGSSVTLVKGGLCIDSLLFCLLSDFNQDLETWYLCSVLKTFLVVFLRSLLISCYVFYIISGLNLTTQIPFSLCFWIILGLVAGFLCSIFCLTLIFFSLINYWSVGKYDWMEFILFQLMAM